MTLVGPGVIFARYRGELVAGARREQAVRTALDAAGRTVFFAGYTVIVALLGLIVPGPGFRRGVGDRLGAHGAD